jgi:hypothetical protein
MPNRRFEFEKRGQLVICSHNETLSIAAMRVSNPDRSSSAVLSETLTERVHERKRQ